MNVHHVSMYIISLCQFHHRPQITHSLIGWISITSTLLSPSSITKPTSLFHNPQQNPLHHGHNKLLRLRTTSILGPRPHPPRLRRQSHQKIQQRPMEQCQPPFLSMGLQNREERARRHLGNLWTLRGCPQEFDGESASTCVGDYIRECRQVTRWHIEWGCWHFYGTAGGLYICLCEYDEAQCEFYKVGVMVIVNCGVDVFDCGFGECAGKGVQLDGAWYLKTYLKMALRFERGGCWNVKRGSMYAELRRFGYRPTYICCLYVTLVPLVCIQLHLLCIM